MECAANGLARANVVAMDLFATLQATPRGNMIILALTASPKWAEPLCRCLTGQQGRAVLRSAPWRKVLPRADAGAPDAEELSKHQQQRSTANASRTASRRLGGKQLAKSRLLRDVMEPALGVNLKTAHAIVCT